MSQVQRRSSGSGPVSGSVQTLTGNGGGGAVPPDLFGNINLVGVNMTIVGDALANTITFTATGGAGVPQDHIFYVSAVGNDALSGRTWDEAFATFQAAFDAVTALVPSPSNRYAVVCLDSAEYGVSAAIPVSTDLYAPNAVFVGGLEIGEDSSIRLHRLYADGIAYNTGVFYSVVSTTSPSSVNIDIIECAADVTGLYAINGNVTFTFQTIAISGSNSRGIAISHTDSTDISIYGGDIYLSGDASIGIFSNILAVGKVYGRLHSITAVVGSTFTSGVITYNGEIELYINSINCDSPGYATGIGAVVNVFFNECNGDFFSSFGGLVKTWRTQPIMTNGQLLIGAGTNAPNIATLTAGTGISIDNTVPGEITISSGALVTYTPVSFALSPYNILDTDYFISIDATGGPVTVNLPTTTTLGKIFYIKDKNGQATTNTITVASVPTIDNAASYVFTVNYQSIGVIFNGTNYEVF